MDNFFSISLLHYFRSNEANNMFSEVIHLTVSDSSLYMYICVHFNRVLLYRVIKITYQTGTYIQPGQWKHIPRYHSNKIVSS